MADTRKKQRAINRAEILKAEWTVLVGESIVALGSIAVVIGLIRAFRVLVNDEEHNK